MADASGEAVAAVLAEHLVGVRPLLQRVAIEGDGHCQFRGASVQCRGYGYNGYARMGGQQS